MDLPPFHLAIPVSELAPCVAFYRDLLGCGVGRQSERWCDLNLRGHQVVLHQVDPVPGAAKQAHDNPVDGDRVPVPHFGLVLDWAAWELLGAKIRTSEVCFLIEPRVRFRGKAGEQGTFFLRDPSGNALEFKAFRDPGKLFAV